MDSVINEHIQDLRVIEVEVMRIQAAKYYGNIILSFKAGILSPVLSLHETKKVKDRGESV